MTDHFDKTVTAFIEARKSNTPNYDLPPRNVRSREAQKNFRNLADRNNVTQFTPEWSALWWSVMEEVWRKEETT
jgi:hypothetical protein